MKIKTRRVPARFKLEPRFDVPITSAPRRGPIEQELERLKERLLTPWLEQASHPTLRWAYRHAATEAATLAWLTPFPLLVLPVLLEEKAHTALTQAKRQEQIRERSEELLAEVA